MTYPSGAYAMYGYDAADNRSLLVMSLTANNLPVANPDGVSPPIPVAASGATNIDVLANDMDSDNDARTVYQVTNGAKGQAAIVPGALLVSYTPTPGQTGPDSFTYTIIDARGGVSAPATVYVTIAGNQPPNANDDPGLVTPYNTPLTNINVIANDTDPGDTFSVTGVGNPTNGGGTTSRSGNLITYTPANGFSGATSFTYTITDSLGLTDTATVSVTVGAAPNGAPTANTDSNVPVAYSGPTPIYVLANDTDPDSDPLSVISVTNGSKGTVTNQTNSVSYQPNSGATGSDTFQYTISDGHGHPATGTVTVNIGAPPNAAPIPNYYGTSDVPFDYNTGHSFDPRGDNYDPDGDTMTIVNISTQPQHGTATATATSISYTPSNYSGADYLYYTISDGHQHTVTARVNLGVGPPPNQAPVAVNDPSVGSPAYVTPYGQGISIPVMSNDYDPNGDTFYIDRIDPPNAAGTPSLVGNNISWQPAIGYSGTTSFTYSLKDSRGLAGNSATVTVTVQPAATLTAAVSSAAYTRRIVGTQPQDGTPLNVAVSVAGGVGPYTYSWTKAPGSDAGTSISSTSGSFSGAPWPAFTWSHATSGPVGSEWDSTWTVTVTDSASHSSSATVDVVIVKDSS